MRKGHIATLSASRIWEAKVEDMLRDPPPKTWSARMPAYCYTELCPDRGATDASGGCGADEIGRGC